MGPWRFYRPVVADFYHFEEELELDLDPDPHLSEKLEPDTDPHPNPLLGQHFAGVQ